MYQITTTELCDELINLSQRGVEVSLLVSSRVYAQGDCSAAQQCYAKLYASGLQVHKSSLDFSYSHDKYWIRDGKNVAWSTGNWSPSDYPTNHSNVYPVFPDPDWWKSNRDFTIYTDSVDIVSQFDIVFQQDSAAPNTHVWEPTAGISCGY